MMSFHSSNSSNNSIRSIRARSTGSNLAYTSFMSYASARRHAFRSNLARAPATLGASLIPANAHPRLSTLRTICRPNASSGSMGSYEMNAPRSTRSPKNLTTSSDFPGGKYANTHSAITSVGADQSNFTSSKIRASASPSRTSHARKSYISDAAAAAVPALASLLARLSFVTSS